MSKRKTPSQEGPNSDFCEFLLEIAEYEKNVTRNIYKYNAYRKAASILAQHSTRISSGKEAKKLEGIGQKIADKIDEFIKTGKVKKLEKIRSDDDNQSITFLTKVFGIGPASAKKFVDQGITTITDLEKHKDLLNRHQKIGLKYFRDFEKKIPRSEMQKLEYCHIIGCDENCFIFAGAAESGDIDILLTHKKYSSEDAEKPELLTSVIKRLEDIGLIEEQISCSGTKFMGVCRLKEKHKHHPFRRIDIRIFPFDQYFCAALYFTGSNLFNKQMRAHALKEGFTINEYCIRPLGIKGTPGEALPVTSEKDIFEYINYPYKKPEDRNV